MGFMMPISTPPNAIVYSSGHMPITAMMRHGIVLDVVGFVVIVAFVLGLGWVCCASRLASCQSCSRGGTRRGMRLQACDYRCCRTL